MLLPGFMAVSRRPTRATTSLEHVVGAGFGWEVGGASWGSRDESPFQQTTRGYMEHSRHVNVIRTPSVPTRQRYTHTLRHVNVIRTPSVPTPVVRSRAQTHTVLSRPLRLLSPASRGSAYVDTGNTPVRSTYVFIRRPAPTQQPIREYGYTGPSAARLRQWRVA